jgi:hypothetical protein
MANVYTKSLGEVLTLPSANNAIKKVTLDIRTYDDSVGANTYISWPVQAILSDTDLQTENYITTANAALTQTDIINWAWNEVGGDDYYNTKIKPAVDVMLADQLQFAGVATANVAAIPV